MPLYVYTRDIPFASNNPSVDQPKMQTNTDSIDSLIGVDHVSFNQNLGGYHTVIHQQASPGNADPAPIALTGQTYVKDVTNGITTDQALFFESGGGRVTQLTSFGSPVTTVVASSNGYLFLPGGILMQWGKITGAVKNATTSINFNAANINFPNNCFGMEGTLSKGTSGGVITLIPSASAFTYHINTSSGQTLDFFWTAIGN